jgi:hypothetical protein
LTALNVNPNVQIRLWFLAKRAHFGLKVLKNKEKMASSGVYTMPDTCYVDTASRLFSAISGVCFGVCHRLVRAAEGSVNRLPTAGRVKNAS